MSSKRVFDVARGFMTAKILLSAVEMDIFPIIAQTQPGRRTAKEITKDVGGSSEIAICDMLDCLVAMEFLHREDRVANPSIYSLTDDAAVLVKDSPSYVGGMLRHFNDDLYPQWNLLTEAILSGNSQIERPRDAFSHNSKDFLTYYQAMTSMTKQTAKHLTGALDFSQFKTIADIGAAQGSLLVHLCRTYKNIKTIGFDLPFVQPLFEEYTQQFNIPKERLKFVPGDFYLDELPNADLIIFGHILHEHPVEIRKSLLKKAYRALNNSGAVLVYEGMIDNDRRENIRGFTGSLNMRIRHPGASGFTSNDCKSWMKEAGFHIRMISFTSRGISCVIGFKEGAKSKM